MAQKIQQAGVMILDHVVTVLHQKVIHPQQNHSMVDHLHKIIVVVVNYWYPVYATIIVLPVTVSLKAILHYYV